MGKKALEISPGRWVLWVCSGGRTPRTQCEGWEFERTSFGWNFLIKSDGVPGLASLWEESLQSLKPPDHPWEPASLFLENFGKVLKLWYLPASETFAPRQSVRVWHTPCVKKSEVSINSSCHLTPKTVRRTECVTDCVELLLSWELVSMCRDITSS